MRMDCTFSRAEMATALARLSGVLPTRSVLSVAYCVRFSPSDDGESVRMETTDMDRHAEASVRLSEPCEGFAPVCVPIATLLAFARAYTGVSARLAEAARGGLVAFSSGGSKANLPTLPGSEFPDLRLDEPFTEVGSGPVAPFKLALSRVAYALVEDTARPSLQGVNVGSNGEGMCAVALSMAMCAKEYADGWDSEMPPVTIPTVATSALLRFLPDAGNASVLATESRLRFVHDDGSAFTTGTLEHPFPNYQQIIPQNNPISIVVDRAALIDAVQRIKLVLPTGSAYRVLVSLSPSGISLHAESETGSADEFVAAEISGGDLQIGFNAKWLKDTLNSLIGEKVTAEMSEPQKASIWRDRGTGMRLLMPLRLT